MRSSDNAGALISRLFSAQSRCNHFIFIQEASLVF